MTTIKMEYNCKLAIGGFASANRSPLESFVLAERSVLFCGGEQNFVLKSPLIANL
jgi:hypothetical protein